MDGGRFGDYELLERLGRGGMGEVWRAHDTRRGRTVALKLLATDLTARPEFQERFRKEARLTAALTSPHVVPIHDWGEIDGRLYLDMRLVDGGSLADLLAVHPDGLPPDRALHVLGQVAQALDAAHGRSMVHRDVKPANVLVSDGSERPYSYLTDFGIAKILDETSGARLTESGQVLGTLGYLAPEMFTDGEATPASDVYALGCLLHEMLTGRCAVPVTSVPAAMHAHVFGPVPELAVHHPELARLDPVLAAALAKRPEERPATAGDLADAAVAAWEGGRAPEPPPDRPVPPARTVRLGGPEARTDAATLTAEPGRPGRRWPLVVVLTAVLGLFGAGTFAALDPGLAPVASSSAAGEALATGVARVLPVELRAGNGVLPTPDGRAAFLTESDSEDVRRVDLGSGRITDVWRVDVNGPGGMELTPDQGTLAVQLNGNGSGGYGVALIDLRGGGGTAVVPLPARPGDIVFSSDGALVFVSLLGESQAPGSGVAVVDVASRQVIRTVPVTSAPRGVALSADGTTVAVACSGRSGSRGAIALVPVDGGPVTTVPSSGQPRYVSALPDGRFAISVVRTTGASVDLLAPATRAMTQRREPSIVAPQRVVTTAGGRIVVTQNDTTRTPRVAELALLDVASGANVFRVPFAGLVLAQPTPDGQRAVLLSRTSMAVVDLPP